MLLLFWLLYGDIFYIFLAPNYTLVKLCLSTGSIGDDERYACHVILPLL